MEAELISVIVPVYNIEEYLPRCLDCIATQSYRNLEIILVDDGSTDSSGRICDEFAVRDSRIRVIHQSNQGAWAARNAGQDASAGAYLMFPDGDDYFHKDIIRLLYEAINQGPGYDIAMAKEKQVYDYEGDIVTDIIPVLVEKTQEELLSGLLVNYEDFFFVFTWNKLYRRSLIQDIRMRNYSRSEDFDANLRIFLKTEKAVLLDNVLYYWYQHPGSLTKAPLSIELTYSCRSRSIFNTLQDLAPGQQQYRPMLLRKMFRCIAAWKTHTIDRQNRREVRKECRRYVKAEFREYLFCRQVPFMERVGCTVFLLSPRTMRLWMRATNTM